MKCHIEECTKTIQALGLCTTHYMRWRRWGDPYCRVNETNEHSCSVDECSRPAAVRGLCRLHYSRQRKRKPYAPTAEQKQRHAEQKRKRRTENPELFLLNQLRAKVVRYGLTVDAFVGLLKAQKDQCAICGFRFADPLLPGASVVDLPQIDHDHACCPERARSCGVCVRGLLCYHCNKALGHLKDDVASLEAAVRYLAR